MATVADAALPGLATALDVPAFLRLLRSELEARGEEWEVVDARIADVDYRPRSRCLVLYRVVFRHRLSGRTTRRFVSGRAWRADEERVPPPSELLDRYEGYRRKVARTPVFDAPDEHLTVYQFPVDPRLPWLFDAIDSRLVKRHLQRAWGQRKLRIGRVTTDILGYTPQSRATMLYHVLAEDKETGEVEARRLVAKTHFSKPPDKLFANAWALGRAANGTVGLAGLVAYIAPLRMTLQEEVRGERLANFAGTPSFVPLVRKTARSIAAVHHLALPLKGRRGPEQELRVVARWTETVAAIRPDLTTRVERLGDRLVAGLGERAVKAGPIHGDFHPGNVLTAGEDVTLIDLDEVSVSDPFVDVGRFLASLRVSAMRVFADPAGLLDAEDAFLDEYLHAAPGDEASARLFEAASLLIAAAAPFRLQRAGWERAAGLLVEEAERTLALAGDAGGRRREAPEQARMSHTERREWATDPVYMQAMLDPHLRELHGADVTACSVRSVRERDDGYRISYRLSGWRAGEKWRASAVGLIRREGRGRRLGEQVKTLRAALHGLAEAPLLPTPVAYVSKLALLVLEQPRGERLSSLIHTPAGADAAAKLARALLVLRDVPIEVDAVRSLEDELHALRRAVDRLYRTRRALYTRAHSLLAEVESVRAAAGTTSVVFSTLDPRQVLVDGDAVAIADVSALALSDPRLDAGDFLARLALIGMEAGDDEMLGEAARRFRREYVAGGGGDRRELAAFEAAALLRLAAAEAERGAAQGVPERLVAAAAAALAAAS